jgi:hypothetical protein
VQHSTPPSTHLSICTKAHTAQPSGHHSSLEWRIADVSIAIFILAVGMLLSLLHVRINAAPAASVVTVRPSIIHDCDW